MKNSYKMLVVAAALLSAPIMSYAQSVDNQQPVTRAQVKHELAELEAAGYNPNDWYNYPQNVQAAEAKVAAQHQARALAAQATAAQGS
jgi:Domain of unknown function (DUF4148)